MREPTTDELIDENKILKYLILKKKYPGMLDMRWANSTVKSIYNNTVRYKLSIQTVYTYLERMAGQNYIDLISNTKTNEKQYRANEQTEKLFAYNSHILNKEKEICLKRVQEIEEAT